MAGGSTRCATVWHLGGRQPGFQPGSANMPPLLRGWRLTRLAGTAWFGRRRDGGPRKSLVLLSPLLAVAFRGTALAAEPAGATSPTGPRRIVTISPNAAEIICALGCCDRIVGVDKFCVFPDELRDRARVGGLFDPDLERIVALKPDLIVLRGRSESVTRLASDLGARLLEDRTERLDDIAGTVRQLGGLLGREAEAERLVDEFNERLRKVRERVDGRPTVRVFVAVSRRSDEWGQILTTGRGTFIDDVVRVAGGTNIFEGVDAPWPEVTLEGAVARRPQVVIELVPEARLADPDRESLRAAWQSALRIGGDATVRVAAIDDDHALIPSPRYVEIVERLAKILHSEIELDPKPAGRN